MSNTLRLTLEPHREEGKTIEAAATLAYPGGKHHRLWWRLPAQWREALTPWADPFVVAFLFPMMQERRDVMVEGAVSPSLLANLEQYMALWRMWEPDKYQPVVIHAREEIEPPAPDASGQAIMPFSCGVDSCYTMLRHRRGLIGRRMRQITAGMVMFGFDIWLDQDNARGMYDALLKDARAVLADIGVTCIEAASNFHELPTTWGYSFGTHLLSGLRLLGGRFDTGILANDVPYNRLHVHWGSHPVANPFLSAENFQVVDDGAEMTRDEKIEVLAQWPEAMRHLRVCYSNPGSHANCCRCEKCIRTILAFRAVGMPLPGAFASDVTDRQIRRVRFHSRFNVRQWQEILEGAERRGFGDADWVQAARDTITRNEQRWRRNRIKMAFVPLRNRIRTLFRGSPLSRTQLQAK